MPEAIPRYRFQARQRLLKPAEFKAVFEEQPRKSSDRYFTLLAYSNSVSPGRLGLAIAKKRVRLAVQRNRIKRLLRESFRRNQHRLSGWDIVALARDGCVEQSNQTLSRALERHWQRLLTPRDTRNKRKKHSAKN